MTARHAITIRLSPADQEGQRLLGGLQPLLEELSRRAGVAGAHLLKHCPPQIAVTAEQKIRGGDSYADWVLVIVGYELETLDDIAEGELGTSTLQVLGAAPGAKYGRFQLSYSATPADIA